MGNDPSQRKKEHIELAFKSQAEEIASDTRFNYEPVLSGYLSPASLRTEFLGKTLQLPLWISSMTGGTEAAGRINRNLAQACSFFGIGMGLGSCRILLEEDSHFEDFNLRPIIGKDLPFFANLGIAQVEKMLQSKNQQKITDLCGKLGADGLIVHVNPLQEWLQQGGDRLEQPPLETIEKLLASFGMPLIVKEVGQGMGPESLRALLQLPLAAVDFGAYGGTNFSMLELLRQADMDTGPFKGLAAIGHTAGQMVEFVNRIVEEDAGAIRCRQIIVSGGIRNFLDGYYYTGKLKLPSIYAQGSAFLRYAQDSFESLKNYIQSQADGLTLAKSYLRIR